MLKLHSHVKLRISPKHLSLCHYTSILCFSCSVFPSCTLQPNKCTGLL